MGKTHRSRKGSLGFSPRKRAKRIVPRVRAWPLLKGAAKLAGFMGYKVGMAGLFYIDRKETSPYYGREVFTSGTIIETPPMNMFGIRIYKPSTYGLRCIGEAWSKNLSRDLKRKLTIKGEVDHSLNDLLSKATEETKLRALVHTSPRLAGVHKKKPEILEIPVVGGKTLDDKVKFIEEKFGGTVRVSEVFKTNQFIDVTGVTKGKGFQGVLKRWGVKKLPRKTRKRRREVGSLGPWHPSKVLWTVPRAGQMGFHQRTEYNKLIFVIGEDGNYTLKGEKTPITPEGGFPHYGIVKSDFLVLKGSVQGPPKRTVVLRHSVRTKEKEEHHQLIQVVYG